MVLGQLRMGARQAKNAPLYLIVIKRGNPYLSKDLGSPILYPLSDTEKALNNFVSVFFLWFLETNRCFEAQNRRKELTLFSPFIRLNSNFTFPLQDRRTSGKEDNPKIAMQKSEWEMRLDKFCTWLTYHPWLRVYLYTFTGCFFWSALKNYWVSDYIVNPIKKVLSVRIS